MAVCEVDRVSRSILDFAKIMEILEKRGATFASATQAVTQADRIGDAQSHNRTMGEGVTV